MATANNKIELNQVSIEMGLPIAYSCYNVIEDRVRKNKKHQLRSTQTYLYNTLQLLLITTLYFICYSSYILLKQHRLSVSPISSL